MDILQLDDDQIQSFYERDKKYVEEYLAIKEEYDRGLARINVSRVEDWDDDLVDQDKSYFLQKVFYNKETDQRSFYIVEQEAKKYGLGLEDIYKINEDGFRCESFTNQPEGLRILFAGCSVTFGHGIPEPYTWPQLVYSELSKRASLSSYHNIAKLGISRLEVMLAVSEYIDYFGMPDLILINMPNSGRDSVGENDYNTTKLNYATRALYNRVAKSMSDSGGLLLSTSWSTEDLLGNDSEMPSTLASIESHLKFTLDDFLEFIYGYAKKNKKHEFAEYMIKSMDLAHPGLAEHAFYAKLFLDKLKDVV